MFVLHVCLLVDTKLTLLDVMWLVVTVNTYFKTSTGNTDRIIVCNYTISSFNECTNT